MLLPLSMAQAVEATRVVPSSISVSTFGRIESAHDRTDGDAVAVGRIVRVNMNY
jgi:hypothetical protein